MSAAAGLRERAPLTPAQAARWAAKGRELAAPLLRLAGDLADPAPVAARCAAVAEWPFGAFMVAWLDGTGPVRHVCHLPDAGFFLSLLDRAYSGVFERRPELRAVLLDDSRLEMSLTNDTLQIQLADGLGADYSMIRNHALMLFLAALWLEEPARSAWLDLYDEVVTYVDQRPVGRPDLAAVAQVETAAFADFVALAPETLDPTAAQALLDSDRLEVIVEYQLLAAVAIGLLWRDYRLAVEERGEKHDAWLRHQLSQRYGAADCLDELWMQGPTPREST